MGYYTKHELEIISGNDNVTDYEKEIGEISEYGDSVFEESIKWHDCIKDMLEYSKKHPKTLFCITGEGEESGDLWKHYYLNGKMQNCEAKIVYDEFDETKLS